MTYHVIPPATAVDSIHILYVQDGNDYLDLGGFEETFTYAGLQDWQVVMVHPGTSQERWHAYHSQGDDFTNFINFMYEELMPVVEKGVIVRKRAVLGESLAASISLNMAAQKPAIWSHVLLQSAAITADDIAVVNAIDKPISWSVQQTVGTIEDGFISPITNECLYIYSRNKQLAEVFRQKEVEVQFVEEEESHLWTYWKRLLPIALRFLSVARKA